MSSGHLILCFILSRKTDTLYEAYDDCLYYNCHLRRGVQARRMTAVSPPSRKSHRDFCLCKSKDSFFNFSWVELENKVEINLWNLYGIICRKTFVSYP